MTHNAVLGDKTYDEIQVIAEGHGPMQIARLVKSDQGELAGGQILSLDENALLIPYQEETKDLGTGDDEETTFSDALDLNNLAPGTVSVTDGGGTPQTLQDDGSGRLYGDGSGTVNYKTGAVSVTFDAAPTNGDTVSATAKNKPEGVNVRLVDTAEESAALIVKHGTVKRTSLLVGSSAAASADMALLEEYGIYPV